MFYASLWLGTSARAHVHTLSPYIRNRLTLVTPGTTELVHGLSKGSVGAAHDSPEYVGENTPAYHARSHYWQAITQQRRPVEVAVGGGAQLGVLDRGAQLSAPGCWRVGVRAG